MTSSDIIATSSVVVAVCALVATIYQAWLSRCHNRLQVQPSITIESNTTSDNMYIAIHNFGLGPALIDSIIASYKGLQYDLLSDSGIDGLTNHVTSRAGSTAETTYVCLQVKSPIAVGAYERILELSNIADLENEFVTIFLHEILITVNYSCIYGKNFVANNTTKQ